MKERGGKPVSFCFPPVFKSYKYQANITEGET